MLQCDEVHQGKLCLLVIQSMVNSRMNKAITVEEAIKMLEHVGWVHNLHTYQQKKKHVYEVLRRSRRDGLTSLRLNGNDIYLSDEENEVQDGQE